MMIFLFLGLIQIVYYLIIKFYRNGESDFYEFWILSGFGFILLFILRQKNVFTLDIEIHFVLMLVSGIGIITAVIIQVIIVIYAKRGKQLTQFDYVIILGNGLRGKLVSDILENRLLIAIEEYRKRPNIKIIVSGGRKERAGISEAQAMYDYLVLKGIQKNNIIKEEQSRTTYENFIYTKKIINCNNNILIVTSGFHLFRAVMIGKHCGFVKYGAIAAPTDCLLIPHFYIRELFTVVADKFLGHY